MNRKVFRYKLRAMLILLGFTVFSSASAVGAKIGIIVFDGFLTSDVTAAVEVFGAASKKAWFSSYEVLLVSSEGKRQVTSEEGLTIVADALIDKTIEFDALIVPSAYKMKPHLRNTALIDFIKRQHKHGAWMSSNCSGALLLGEAGVLDNKRATTWAGGEKKLARLYKKVKVVVDQNVVVDEKLVTTNGGPVSYQGALTLLAKLSSHDYALEVADAIQFSRLTPFVYSEFEPEG